MKPQGSLQEPCERGLSWAAWPQRLPPRHHRTRALCPTLGLHGEGMRSRVVVVFTCSEPRTVPGTQEALPSSLLMKCTNRRELEEAGQAPAAGGPGERDVNFVSSVAPRCRARPGHSRHPTGPSARRLLWICAHGERLSWQRPEQTRKTALLRCAREPAVGAAARLRRGLGRLPSAAPPRPPPEVGPAAPAGGGVQARREAALDSAPLRVCALLPAGRSALLRPSMEEGRSPSPGEDLELLTLGGQPEEQKPFNGTVQVIPLSVEEEPLPAQVRPAWRCGRCPSAL